MQGFRVEGARRNPAVAGVSWLVGAAVTLAAVTVSVILAMVFAATVAVAAIFGGGLIGLWALAVRMRRAPQLQRVSTGPVILDARKVGHSWVAYGWDQSTR